MPNTYRPTTRRWIAAAGLAAVALAMVSNPRFRSLVERHTAAQDRDFLSANIDASANPGTDFFQYANGAWLAAHPIPPSESHWGIGDVVQEEIYASLKAINETSAASATSGGGAGRGSDQQKIGDFWSTAMDEAHANRLGLTPLASELSAIDRITTLQQGLDVAFSLHTIGVNALFAADVSQDERHSDEMSVHVAQGGLGLPNRDYYFDTEEGVARARRDYLAHLAKLLTLIGRGDHADRAAANVMAFETALAKTSRTLAQLRDPQKNYNRMTPAALTSQRTPSIAWTERLAHWQLRPQQIVVGQPEYFAALETTVRATPTPVLKDYLRLRLVSVYAPYLTTALDDEQFDFSGRLLQGQQEQRPRWKRALDAEESAMGMVLGRLFVKAYFPAPVKQRYSDLVEAIRDAYRERIERLDWMSPATKAKAQQKLAAMKKKVGYPDRWKDYSALQIDRDSYARNMMRAARWRFDDNVAKFGKPVDRDEWDMTPQTYNAYYSPSNNEIVLPAAIFAVPGIADGDIDDAVVYGYAGASTIGHEMTHGFDDEGRQYDLEGNLVDWWTADDAQQFKARAEVMVQQFDAYEPLPGLHVKGDATLGENIADHGGLLLALDAFKKTAQYRNGTPIGGLSPLQRYFLGYALGWLGQQRPESLRRQLLSDVHAPAKWRVLGPLANIPEFHQAFGIEPGHAMYRSPQQQVSIW